MVITNRILVTEYRDKILVCHMTDDKADRIFLEDPCAQDVPVGSILIGKVKKIVPGIHAAFLSLGTEREYFMSLPPEQDSSVLLVNRPYDGTIKCGDELVVQVKKQAAKTKQPTADCHPSFAGRYAVIQTGQKGFHVSSKLNRKQREPLETLGSEFSGEDEIIVRTNATAVSPEDVRKDIRGLKEQLERLKSIYKYRTCYSVLYQPLPEYLTVIRDIPADAYDEIVTDSPVWKERIEEILSGSGKLPPIRFYKDTSYPLIKLYSIETMLQELLQKKVWLKSGGFLIIEQTETLTAIDVNTGKSEKKRDMHFYTNMEAVPELCRQLRARNISGMILVDFINMKKKEQTEALIEALKAELRKDYVKADYIDMTGLGLVEITREKRFAPLKEMV